MNTRRGTVLMWEEARQRYYVTLDATPQHTSVTVALRGGNLQEMSLR